MENFSTDVIEGIAINSLAGQLAESSRIRPMLDENDKTPSWDGEIFLYEDGYHTKEKLVGRCPVQVKGHQCRAKEECEQKSIKYRVETSDIRNYERDGGVIFFVVYLYRGKKWEPTVYFRSLQRNELWGYLQDKGEQGTISIEFYRFPEKPEDMEAVFSKFLENQKNQCVFIRDEDKTAVPITSQTKYLLLDITPQTILDGKPKILYRKNPSCPNMAFEARIVILETEIKDMPMPVLVNGEQFFSHATINFKKGAKVNKIILNHGLHIIIKKNRKGATLKIKTNCNMEDCIQNFRFMIAMKKYHELTIGNFAKAEQVEINDPNNILEESLEQLLKIKKLFEVMHVKMKKDVFVSDFSAEMMRNFFSLYQCLVLNKDYDAKQKKINEKVMFSVGPYSFLLIKMIKKDGHAHLYNFWDPELSFQIGTKYEESVPSVSAFLLSEDDIRHADNVDYEVIQKSVTNLQYGQLIAEVTNRLLLQLLNVYDDKKRAGIERKDLLSCAEGLAKWQWKHESEDSFYMNVLQVFARQRHLTEAEEDELFAINSRAEGFYKLEIHAGVASLLGNQVAYRNYLKLMDEDQRNNFKQTPISNFMKNN